MVSTEDGEGRKTSFDGLADGLISRLRQEPVAMSVAAAIVAAALTDSIVAFALGGAAAWFAGQRIGRAGRP